MTSLSEQETAVRWGKALRIWLIFCLKWEKYKEFTYLKLVSFQSNFDKRSSCGKLKAYQLTQEGNYAEKGLYR